MTATDVESSQPVRPGAPDMGRPTQRLDIKDRVTLSSLANDRAAADRASSDPMTYRNPKEGARAKAVEELAKNAEVQAIISADKDVPHGKVIGLLDVVKTAGVKKFAISIEKK